MWECGEGEQNGDELSVRKLSVNISVNWENVCGSKAVDRRHGGDADDVWSGVNPCPEGDDACFGQIARRAQSYIIYTVYARNSYR